MEKKLKGYKIATLVVSLVAVAAITTLGIILGMTAKDRSALSNDIENVYERAFYELISNVNEMEISYSKLQVTNSKGMQIELLNEIEKNSQLAGAALSTLSTNNYNAANTTRYINQAGDYAMSLVNKLGKGDELSKDDREMLDSLYKMTRQIGDELAKISTEIAKGDFNFAEMLDVEDGILSEVFMGLEESIVEYPALIYDGPFSSALLEKEAKGLEGEEDITKEEGVTIINEMLEDLELKNVKYKGDCKSYFDCFNYEAETADGETVSIDLSVKGGKLISLNISRDVEEPKYSPEECALLAEQYAEDLGFEDMKSVWVSNYNSIIYVNLAPVVNDIVWYPDLVKIKIASNDGKLLGVEALSYTYNHIERNLSSPSVSESQARSAISASIKVETARLALIPYNGGTELLTYEFSGTSGDSVFYVYIDAETGEEVKVLRVIDSDEGTLLM